MSIDKEMVIIRLLFCIAILEATEDERYPLVGELSRTFSKYPDVKEFLDFANPIIGTSGRYQLEKEEAVAQFISGQLFRRHPTSARISRKISYDVACLLYRHRKKRNIAKKTINVIWKSSKFGKYNFERVSRMIKTQHTASQKREKAINKPRNIIKPVSLVINHKARTSLNCL